MKELEEKIFISIREMAEKDLDEVMAIEKRSFPSPWSRELFKKELQMPLGKAFVAQETPLPQIVGYFCCWLIIPEVHILNIAVHPQKRHRGIGSKLLQYGLAYAWQKGGRHFTLEVRRSNYPAIGLYKKFNFQPWGIRRRYYTDTGEDALVMCLQLDEAPVLAWL